MWSAKHLRAGQAPTETPVLWRSESDGDWPANTQHTASVARVTAPSGSDLATTRRLSFDVRAARTHGKASFVCVGMAPFQVVWAG
jgi:hypothetical protein